MANTLIDGSKSLKFGITDTAALGFFESLEYEEQSELLEVPSGDGSIIAADFYGRKYSVSGTFVYDSTQYGNPRVGGTIALSQNDQALACPATIYVTRVKETYSNSDVMKVDFDGMAWPDIS